MERLRPAKVIRVTTELRDGIQNYKLRLDIGTKLYVIEGDEFKIRDKIAKINLQQKINKLEVSISLTRKQFSRYSVLSHVTQTFSISVDLNGGNEKLGIILNRELNSIDFGFLIPKDAILEL